MKYLLSLLAILLNIGIASAQIEVTDSTSTGWGGGTNVDVTPSKPTGKVTSLSLSQDRLLLSGGQTAQLVAAVNADAANKSVTWSVADKSIATVSANGLVTAVTTGQTVVTATTVDGGLTAQCLVTVKSNAKVYVERITLDITEMEMYVGEKKAVTPTVYPDNATDKTLRWETRGVDYYNPALPDENNVFTAYKPGVIALKIYPNDGSEAYAVCKVTVKDRPLTKMTLPSEIVLNINEMKTLKPEVTPELFQMKFKWTVADPTIAYVTSSGRITGVQTGTTTVTATALDGTGISATSKITVTSNVADLGYSGWILERGEDIHPWTALCFHESGYYEKPASDDSKGNKWYSPDYDDSSWYYTYGPLMHRVWPGGGERRTGYGQWEKLDNSTMSIRQKFYLPDVSGYDFTVFARVYQSGEVYINGHRVYITDTGDWKRNGSFMAFIDPSYLVMGGENTIAIIGMPSGEDQYLDFGIHYETNIPVNRVIIKQKELTLMINELAKLEAVVKPDNASRKGLKWESTYPSIASVDEEGNVTGVGEGKATITATSVDGTNIVASCEVTVTNMMIAEAWVKDNGQNTPWNAKYQYCRTSDELYNNGPANDGAGRVWTAKDYDDSAWGTVKGPIGHEVGNHYETYWPDNNSRYYLRETFTVTDLASYTKPQLFLAHDDGIIVWVNGTKVHEQGNWNLGYYVDIPDGILTEGSNVICIQVSEGGGGAYIDYGVSMTGLFEVVPANGITLDKTSVTLKRNEKVQLTATISPDNAYYKDVEWTSSHPEIVVVDENGNIKGLAAGEAVITVHNKHGKQFTATCRVTVSNEIVPVKAGEWVIAKEDEWQARILPATSGQALFNSEPTKDADGNKWTNFNYDDAQWTEIISPMDKDHGFFPDNSRYYVRSKFVVGDLSSVNSMRLWMAHDDEALVYVNGILVACFEGAGTGEITLPTELFVKGDNVICVNIHQGGGDAYLDFALMGSGDEAYYTPVESVTLDWQRMTLVPGDMRNINASVRPESADYKDLVWSSDNSDVVKVSADGEVTALHEGVATVTARNIMSGIEAQCRILVIPASISQELSLSAGWNWISHCISSPVSLEWLASAERIMSQTEENYNDPQLGMAGNINSLMPGKAYKVKTPAALANTVSGRLHDLASAPIEMEKGWNWVSYPFFNSMTLQNAIVGAEEGDYIVSHLDGFAEYADGQWQGTMSSLTSGTGYLYKSSSKKAFEIDLFASTALSLANMNDDTATQPTAMVDARMYPSTLNVIAVLSDDRTGMPEDCQVYAFVGNECRGVSRNIGGTYFITVYGDVAATVKFLVKNMRTGLEYEAEGTLTFCEDVVGSVKDPLVLTMTPSAIRRIFDNTRKYKVYSVEGVMVKDGITADQFSELPRGIYIIDGQKVIIE